MWILLNRYHVDRGQAQQVDLSALNALEFKGDLEGYLDQLDSILSGMVKPPDEDILHILVEPQLRKCKAMIAEFLAYDLAPEGSPERTI